MTEKLNTGTASFERQDWADFQGCNDTPALCVPHQICIQRTRSTG